MDEQQIFGVDPVATGLTPLHFLRHFYYGGIAYVGTKQWKEALNSFFMVSGPTKIPPSLLVWPFYFFGFY